MAHGAAVYNKESVAYKSTEERTSGRVYVLPRNREETRSFYITMKRFFDVVLSIISLIAFSPLFLLMAIAIKLEDGGPVIYAQTRVGKNGRPFRFYKFRSMCVDAEEKLHELKDFNESDGPVFKVTQDPRITQIGKIIRKTSIDELPQL